MIERAGLLRVRKHVLAAVVLDLDVTLFDVDIRRAILAHRPELHQVTIVRKLSQRKQHVQCADHVVDLRERCVAAVNHRVGRGALLREMNHGFRLEFLNRSGQKFVVGHVSDEEFDGLAGVRVPGAQPVGERADRSEGLRAELEIPLAAQKVVYDCDRVTLLRQIQSRGPAAIAVSPQHSNLHVSSVNIRCSVTFDGRQKIGYTMKF